MGFAEQFMQGLMMGRAEQERKKQQALAEQWHQQQADMQKKQFERQTALDERGKALEDIRLIGMLPQPEQALPPGQAGPPMPLPKRTVNVPNFGVVTPPDLTDLLAQKRAQDDLEQQRKIDEDARKREAGMLDFSANPALGTRLGFAPGTRIDPKLAELAGSDLSRQAQERAAAATRDLAGATRQAAADAKAKAEEERQASIDEWAQKVHRGEVALDEVQLPTKDRGVVGLRVGMMNQQKPGSVFSTKKDRSTYNLLEEGIRAAEEVKSLHKDAYTGLGLTGGGWLPFKSQLSGKERANFNAAEANLTTSVKKKLLGAAQSIQELKGIVDLLPAVTDSDTVFMAKLDQFINAAKKQQGIYLHGAPLAAPQVTGQQQNDNPLGLDL